MIYLSSDPHFGHAKDFLWRPRGFSSVEEMNEGIIERWNLIVEPNDDVYLLGDVIMGDISNLNYVRRLNGNLHIIYGNHDTNARILRYAEELDNAEIHGFATTFKYKKKQFMLSHYPTITSNMETNPYMTVFNLYGHTHQNTNFYENSPFMYHVGVDSHNCYPILIDDIISDIYAEIDKIKKEKNNEN